MKNNNYRNQKPQNQEKVVKTTPKRETELYPEEKLLLAIFGEKGLNACDPSLCALQDGKDATQSAQQFTKTKGDDSNPNANKVVRIVTKAPEKAPVNTEEKTYEDYMEASKLQYCLHRIFTLNGTNPESYYNYMLLAVHRFVELLPKDRKAAHETLEMFIDGLVDHISENAMSTDGIKIYANPEKGTVIVKKGDEVVKAKATEGDTFSLEAGVAIALCKLVLGLSNREFKELCNAAVVKKPKLDVVETKEEKPEGLDEEPKEATPEGPVEIKIEVANRRKTTKKPTKKPTTTRKPRAKKQTTQK